MRHRASWPPPQGLPVQDKLSLPQRPASHPSVMTRPSAAPSVSLVATPGLTENLRETGICLGRQKAQVGGAGCQPCQYDEDAPRGHEPTDGRQRLVTARRKSAEVVEVDQQKLHEVSSGPEARATLPQRKRLIDKTRQDKTRRTFAPSYPSDHGIARGRQEHVRGVAWMRRHPPHPSAGASATSVSKLITAV